MSDRPASTPCSVGTPASSENRSNNSSVPEGFARVQSGFGLVRGKSLGADSLDQRQEGAIFALIVLSLINVLSFADRSIPGAVKPLLIKDLDLTDFETSLPATGMTFVYMIMAMVFGLLADKQIVDRRLILAAACLCWSLATALAGFATNLPHLILARAFVGVGEAAYATIVPPLIADFFPQKERATAYMVFLLAGPVGGALGFIIGAVLGSHFGWQHAFFALGFPGILASVVVLFINDPFRGVNDGGEAMNPTRTQKVRRANASFCSDLCTIASNRHYVVALAGQICTCFALGGMTDWYGTFLYRYDDTSLGKAGLIMGAGTVLGGIGGTIMGARIAKCFETKVRNAYFLVPAIFTLPAAGFICAATNISHWHNVAYLSLLVGEIFFFTNNVPITTIIISVIPVHLRARSSGIQIFMMHILGDVISPPIIGGVSTYLDPPNPDGLKIAIQVCWIAVLLSGIFWFCGFCCLPPLGVTRSMSLTSIEGDPEDESSSDSEDRDEEDSGTSTE